MSGVSSQPLKSHLGLTDEPSDIAGCILTDESGNCVQCNAYSNLEENQCKCAFEYNADSQMVSATGIPDTYSYLIENNLDWNEDVLPEEAKFSCSSILNAVFTTDDLNVIS